MSHVPEEPQARLGAQYLNPSIADGSQILSKSAHVPKEYVKQRNDWFRAGRYLKTWVEEHPEIHQTELIILDVSESEYMALRVDKVLQPPSGWETSMIALESPGWRLHNDTCVSLSDSGLDEDGPQHRYVRFDRFQIIPFSRYTYQDLGVLTDESLEKLRQRCSAVPAVKRNPDVGRFRELMSRMKRSKAMTRDSPFVSSYDKPLPSRSADSISSHYPAEPQKPEEHRSRVPDPFQFQATTHVLLPVSISRQGLSDRTNKITSLQDDLDVPLDSDAYFDDCYNLQGRLIKKLRPILDTGFTIQSNAPSDQHASRSSLYRLQLILSAIDDLQSNWFCGDFFTLVVDDSARDSVLKTVGIYVSDLHSLMKMLQNQIPLEYDEVVFLEVKYFCDCLLRLFGIRPPPTQLSDAYSAYDAIHMLCRVMALGIISYAGSHCSVDFFALLLGSLPSDDPECWLLGDMYRVDGEPLVFGQCHLACLHSFTGGPIMAFTSKGAFVRRTQFLLSLTLDQFVDLWGPVRLVRNPEDPAQVLSVHTEGGLISKTPGGLSSEQCEVDEIPCHWTKARFALGSGSSSSSDACLYGGEPIHTQNLTSRAFSPFARLLIGAVSRDVTTLQLLPSDSPAHASLGGAGSRIAIRVPRASGSHILPELSCYYNCKMSFHEYISSQHDRVQAAGTSSNCWLPDAYTVGFSGGQWLSLTSTRIYKRSPGVSHKDHIVTHIATSTSSLIRLLSSRTGVEISACTLNSQRITLWRALMVIYGKSVKHYRRCTHEIGDPKCIMTCWNLPWLDTSNWDEQLAQDDNQSKWATLIKPVLSELITPLSYSGFRDDGKLYCALPGNEMMSMEEPLPRWTLLLRDTCRSAAFVVLSPRCLTHECRDRLDIRVLRKCQHDRSLPHRSTVAPMLNTAVFVKTEKLAKEDVFVVPERNGQDTCPRTMARRRLEIPLEDASIMIETTEHPQLASIQRAATASLRQAAGLRRPVYHREYLKDNHREADVVAVVLRG